MENAITLCLQRNRHLQHLNSVVDFNGTLLNDMDM